MAELQDVRPKVAGTGVFMPRVARPASQQQHHDAVRPKQHRGPGPQQRGKHKNKTTAVYMPFGNHASLYGAAHMDVPVLYAAPQPQPASQLGPRSSSSDHSSCSHSSIVLEQNTLPDTTRLPLQHSFGGHTSTAGGVPMQEPIHALGGAPMQAVQEPALALGVAPCAPDTMSTGFAAPAAAGATQMQLPETDLSTAYLSAFSSSGAHITSSSGPYETSSAPGYSIWGPVGQQQQQMPQQQQAQPCMAPAQHMGMSVMPESCSSCIAFVGQPVSMTGLAPQTQGLLGQAAVQVSMPAPVFGLQDMGMQQLHTLPSASTTIVGGPDQCTAAPMLLGQDVQVLMPAQQDCWLASAGPVQLQLLPALGQQLPQYMLVQH